MKKVTNSKDLEKEIKTSDKSNTELLYKHQQRNPLLSYIDSLNEITFNCF